jgi:hypothetical protein
MRAVYFEVRGRDVRAGITTIVAPCPVAGHPPVAVQVGDRDGFGAPDRPGADRHLAMTHRWLLARALAACPACAQRRRNEEQEQGGRT